MLSHRSKSKHRQKKIERENERQGRERKRMFYNERVEEREREGGKMESGKLKRGDGGPRWE